MPALDPNTNLLLHFNGDDEATTTIDSSPYEHEASFIADAQLDTTFKKWGSASLLTDGTGDYITIPDSSAFDFETSDFTIEGWYRFNTLGTINNLVNKRTAGSNKELVIQKRVNDELRITTADSNGGGSNLAATSANGIITDSNFHHIAFVRVGTVLAIYLDGVQVAYATGTAQNMTSTGVLYLNTIIGGGSHWVDGSLDEFRINLGNPFGASPNVGLSNTITVPTEEYGITGFPHSQVYIIS